MPLVNQYPLTIDIFLSMVDMCALFFICITRMVLYRNNSVFTSLLFLCHKLPKSPPAVGYRKSVIIQLEWYIYIYCHILIDNESAMSMHTAITKACHSPVLNVSTTRDPYFSKKTGWCFLLIDWFVSYSGQIHFHRRIYLTLMKLLLNIPTSYFNDIFITSRSVVCPFGSYE